MNFLFTIIGFLVGLAGLNWLLGFQKGNITLDLENRFVDFNSNYVAAIKTELEKQGRTVSYMGNRRFLIDGKTYIFMDRNVSMGGAPLQRTVLKPLKKDI
ncbi:hypothetical protein [Pseudalkalibacillus caeni]|uniref:Uncharacterized protein n=1 Tax=Exobacillus caeni TaxID=2574798 RepID=A0A5R9EWL0_9BACL|nr:hypothetical protein [Pseudalkalibacillus caeni]TLS35221.1 hypothetical protein FCL54_21730 [Pseudalkalibacillus caeni]